MYLLTRNIKGIEFTHYLGVFDTLPDAKVYQGRCEACHHKDKYVYEITPVAHFKGES